MLCDGTITSGSQSFKPQRFEGGGMRFLKFKRWLAETRYCAEWGIDAVYFEEVRRHAGVDAAHAYGGFLAHLTAWCEHHQIPYQGVPVGTIKKHATGKGNASKEDMRSLPQLLRSRSAEFWPVLRSLAAEELERLAGENCRLRKKLNRRKK
jgi:hypothetical protein